MLDNTAVDFESLDAGERWARRTTVHNDFRSQVEGGWDTVDPAIRARMDRLLTAPSTTVFEGKGCVRRSKMGWIFAQLSRVVGAPLVRKQGARVRTIVRVAPTENGLRCWHRLYRFPDGSTQLVETTKVVDPKLGFLDVVGAQGEGLLATQMKVWADGKSLHFSSTTYLLRFRTLTVRIPLFFTPGTLSAEHRDDGNGWFRYSLQFSHPLWGETFYQDGLFRMLDESLVTTLLEMAVEPDPVAFRILQVEDAAAILGCRLDGFSGPVLSMK